MFVLLLILLLLLLFSGGVAVALLREIARLQRRLREAEVHVRESATLHKELNAVRAHDAGLLRALDECRDEDRKKTEWLDHQQQEIDWLRAEMEQRPRITRRRYRILTLGVKSTGKTSLTLKWANPLVDLGALEGTKVERYERTVSHVVGVDGALEHVFEIGDWGGEHVVDAQQELIMEEVHGLLMVVDLADKDGRTLDRARVEEQLREFRPESLKFFFSPKTVASCKAVVLFINKADVLSGTPADVEREARAHYQPLIDALEKYRAHVDVRVLVGSASYGHGTHHLFSHFVERILPKTAYDGQLLQQLRAEPPTRPVRALPPPLPRPLPPQAGCHEQ